MLALHIGRVRSGRPGVIIDCDAAGNLVSLELLNASQCVENPAVVDLAVAGQA